MKKEKGFTLIEIVIALGILVIGVVGLMQVFPVGLQASNMSGIKSDAALLAQKLLDEAKLMGVDHIPQSVQEGRFTCAFSKEEVTLEGSTLNEPHLHTPYKISLTMHWTERRRLRSETFVTYMLE
ncbi:MAG: type II secretion system protein [Candidatus Omnitrophica bacterium]|nr:type II secretion system protein [Candidatus Omnitrophota bacterium]